MRHRHITLRINFEYLCLFYSLEMTFTDTSENHGMLVSPTCAHQGNSPYSLLITRIVSGIARLKKKQTLRQGCRRY